jgi:hypothetical protein
MTKRAPEIEEQYRWLEENFPETGKQVVVTSLGIGESIEAAANANVDRFREAIPVLKKQDREEEVEYHKKLISTSTGELSAKGQYVHGTHVEYLQIPSSLSLSNMGNKYPQFQNIAQNYPDIFTAYSLSQERIHAVDKIINDGSYEKKQDGQFTPLALMKMEAVGEAYSTLSLLQYRQTHGKLDGLDDFLADMRKAGRGSTDLQHALTDESSIAAEKWAKEHPDELARLSARDMLKLSHQIMENLPYPSLDDISALTSGNQANIDKNAWWQNQLSQAEDKTITIPNWKTQQEQPAINVGKNPKPAP